MLTKEQIKELERLNKAATKAPWIQNYEEERIICYEDQMYQLPMSLLGLDTDDTAIVFEAEDAKLIVDARNLLPELLRGYRAYLAEVEHHTAHLDKLNRRIPVRDELMSPVDKFTFDEELNYHRARLTALKG